MITVHQETFVGMHGDEIALLRDYLSGFHGVGVEIGCLDGFSTAHLLECGQLHLTSIDPFIPDSMSPSLVGNRERFLANIAPWKNRHTLIEDYSWNVAPKWNTPLDFLFIDGDHHYEAVLRDYNDWTPHLKLHGLLAVHDSRMHRPGGPNFHEGPSRLVDELVYRDDAHRWQIEGEAFSLTLARKI